MMLTLIYHVKHPPPVLSYGPPAIRRCAGGRLYACILTTGGSLTSTGAMGGLKTDFGQR
jgi:hypothetical protein